MKRSKYSFHDFSAKHTPSATLKHSFLHIPNVFFPKNNSNCLIDWERERETRSITLWIINILQHENTEQMICQWCEEIWMLKHVSEKFNLNDGTCKKEVTRKNLIWDSCRQKSHFTYCDINVTFLSIVFYQDFPFAFKEGKVGLLKYQVTWVTPMTYYFGFASDVVHCASSDLRHPSTSTRTI